MPYAEEYSRNMLSLLAGSLRTQTAHKEVRTLNPQLQSPSRYR